MSGAARADAAQRIARVARELAEVREQLVFIGGAVLPLLVDIEGRFDEPRVTKDVDAVAATTGYVAQHRIEDAIRRAKYRDARTGHIGRYLSPTNEVFDISFAGQHAGATGSPIDALAIALAERHPGPPEFRHLSATGFFLMKVAAFFDRASDAPYASRDLADLAVLLVSCESLVVEARSQQTHSRQLVTEAATRLRSARDLHDSLRSHFRDRRPIPPDTPDALSREALERLDVLASL